MLGFLSYKSGDRCRELGASQNERDYLWNRELLAGGWLVEGTWRRNGIVGDHRVTAAGWHRDQTRKRAGLPFRLGRTGTDAGTDDRAWRGGGATRLRLDHQHRWIDKGGHRLPRLTHFGLAHLAPVFSHPPPLSDVELVEIKGETSREFVYFLWRLVDWWSVVASLQDCLSGLGE